MLNSCPRRNIRFSSEPAPPFRCLRHRRAPLPAQAIYSCSRRATRLILLVLCTCLFPLNDPCRRGLTSNSASELLLRGVPCDVDRVNSKIQPVSFPCKVLDLARYHEPAHAVEALLFNRLEGAYLYTPELVQLLLCLPTRTGLRMVCGNQMPTIMTQQDANSRLSQAPMALAATSSRTSVSGKMRRS